MSKCQVYFGFYTTVADNKFCPKFCFETGDPFSLELQSRICYKKLSSKLYVVLTRTQLNPHFLENKNFLWAWQNLGTVSLKTYAILHFGAKPGLGMTSRVSFVCVTGSFAMNIKALWHICFEMKLSQWQPPWEFVTGFFIQQDFFQLNGFQLCVAILSYYLVSADGV